MSKAGPSHLQGSSLRLGDRSSTGGEERWGEQSGEAKGEHSNKTDGEHNSDAEGECCGVATESMAVWQLGSEGVSQAAMKTRQTRLTEVREDVAFAPHSYMVLVIPQCWWLLQGGRKRRWWSSAVVFFLVARSVVLCHTSPCHSSPSLGPCPGCTKWYHHSWQGTPLMS